MDEDRQKLMDYRQTFLTPHGQRVLEDIARYCCENSNPYRAGSFDATAYNCGLLAVIKRIRENIDVETYEKNAAASNAAD